MLRTTRRFVFSFLWLGLVFAATRASAAPIVAVMPFRDLSGAAGKSPVGEAIRETVTADLKEISDLKVVERSAIDKVLSEQNLQANRSDLDASSTVKVGKLLGASLIATGAYQRAGGSVRLTARFVNVETGEVVGSAKVDGASSDFLQLQDRVTVELLRSAGLAKQGDKIAKRTRPKLKSLRAVEIYGDAIAEPDDAKRVALLKEAVAEEPTFEYAARDLDALEKRLRALEKIQLGAVNKKVEALRQKVEAEKDPEKRRVLEGQLATELMMSRRWFELRRLARSTQLGTEAAAFFLVQADHLLHDWDAVLHDGEAFMKKFPGSMYFAPVKSFVDLAIGKKRQMVEKRAGVDADLAKIEGDQRWDLCRFGYVYRNHDMHEESRRFLRACMTVGTGEPKHILPSLIQASMELGDWKTARRDVEALQQIDSSLANGYSMGIPSDG